MSLYSSLIDRMGFVMGLFPIHDGGFLMITIKGENPGYHDGICTMYMPLVLLLTLTDTMKKKY